MAKGKLDNIEKKLLKLEWEKDKVLGNFKNQSCVALNPLQWPKIISI